MKKLMLLLLVVGVLAGCSSPPPTPTPTPRPTATPTPMPTATPTPRPTATSTPTPNPTPTPSPQIYSDSVVVDAGRVASIPISVQELNRVTGDISIQGGSGNDVNFAIIDTLGNVSQDLGRVSRTRSFAFVAPAAGQYRLRLDNSFSTFSNKVVRYNVTVEWR